MTNSTTQSAWLMTPQLSLYNGATISFWARSAYGPAYPSRLRLLLSTNGASTTISDFSTTLVSVQSNNPNPTLPSSWTQFTVTLSGIATNGMTGRLAFEQSAQSFLNQANVLVDEFSYSVAPAPSALALLGAAGLTTRRRRR
jgi:MYXO-CTERM domain-containing protein